MRSGEEAVFDPGEEFLGKYRVERLLGRGGMGEVYLARNQFLDQAVAIKVLPLRRSTEGLFRERMQREAQAGARLAHDNLVKVIDGGVTSDNVVYIVMEFLDGAKTLRELTWKSRGLDLCDALAYAIQLLDGLAAVHAAGILHRDLKPENVVVLPGGLLKIIDFGLAKVRSSALRTTVVPEGQRMGTLHYMAPEQILGGDVGPKADVYAAGLILHEMVAGQHVFSQETDLLPSVQEVSIMHQLAAPARLDARKTGVPKELADVVEQMLAKDPALRPTALEAGAALERVLAGVVRAEGARAPGEELKRGAHGTMMLPEGFVPSHPLGPFAPTGAVATLSARALAGWSQHVREAPPHDFPSGATPSPVALGLVGRSPRSKAPVVVAGVAVGALLVGAAMAAVIASRRGAEPVAATEAPRTSSAPSAVASANAAERPAAGPGEERPSEERPSEERPTASSSGSPTASPTASPSEGPAGSPGSSASGSAAATSAPGAPAGGRPGTRPAPGPRPGLPGSGL